MPTAKPACATTQDVYVLNTVNNGGQNSVTVYASGQTGNVNAAPLGTIAGSKTGLTNPVALAVDSGGRIYVLNQATQQSGVGQVLVFAPNPRGTLNEAPVATIAGSNSGLSAVNDYAGLALDSSGRIYVTSPSPPSVLVYSANPVGTLNESPIATITGSNTGLTDPQAVAIDRGGRILVGDYNNALLVYPPAPSGTLNEPPVARVMGSGETFYSGLALDAAGNIYATDHADQDGLIYIYPPAPTGTVSEQGNQFVQLGDATGIAVDSCGRIYVGNYSVSAVDVYLPYTGSSPSNVPVETIAGSKTGISSPLGVAVH